MLMKYDCERDCHWDFDSSKRKRNSADNEHRKNKRFKYYKGHLFSRNGNNNETNNKFKDNKSNMLQNNNNNHKKKYRCEEQNEAKNSKRDFQ